MDIAKPVSVLVVDDSAVVRALLVHVLEQDPGIRVVGTAANGAAALEMVGRSKPDVVLMDVHMPGMDGLEVTRRLMEEHPLPVVICSGTSTLGDTTFTFRMLETGAVACVRKPVGIDHPDFERMAGEVRQVVRLMSEVRVVRRRPSLRPAAPAVAVAPVADSPIAERIRVVGIGASTGGPSVVRSLLSGLPRDFPVPILLVQHIAEGFLPGLVDWLGNATGIPVEIARHGVEAQAGRVYLAPDGSHLGMAANGRIVLSRGAPESGLRPAVSHLFRCLAEEYGPAAVGVLLTGMGVDGAAELRLMRDRGAVTLVQDRESSIVFGMPGEAIRLGGATHVLPPERIATVLSALVARRANAAPTSNANASAAETAPSSQAPSSASPSSNPHVS